MASARRRTSGIVLTIAGTLMVALAGAFVILAREPSEVAPRFEGSYVLDATDDGLLAGDASDIFVGRVGKKNTKYEEEGRKGTKYMAQYSVEVLETVKGSVTGTVTISVSKFQDNEPGHPVDKLPKKGEEALFVTKKSPSSGWYLVYGGGYGYYTIHNDEERATLIARFAAAAGLPIPGLGTPTVESSATATVGPTETIEPTATDTINPPTETSAPTETLAPTDTPVPATDTPTVEPPPAETPTTEPTSTETATSTQTATEDPVIESTVEAGTEGP
jgi:hypothetical protein